MLLECKNKCFKFSKKKYNLVTRVRITYFVSGEGGGRDRYLKTLIAILE